MHFVTNHSHLVSPTQHVFRKRKTLLKRLKALFQLEWHLLSYVMLLPKHFRRPIKRSPEGARGWSPFIPSENLSSIDVGASYLSRHRLRGIVLHRLWQQLYASQSALGSLRIPMKGNVPSVKVAVIGRHHPRNGVLVAVHAPNQGLSNRGIRAGSRILGPDNGKDRFVVIATRARPRNGHHGSSPFTLAIIAGALPVAARRERGDVLLPRVRRQRITEGPAARGRAPPLHRMRGGMCG